MEREVRHQCLIYEGPPSQKLRVLATMIEHKLEQGFRCLYLNSAPMVAGMRSFLSAMDIDVANEVAKARLVLSSEPIFPSSYDFDIDLMLIALEDALNQALDDGYVGLWVTGDMSWEFGDKKNFTKLLEYELGLEELFRKRQELQGICQYHKDTLPQEVMRNGLLTHNSIFINETLSRINPYSVQSLFGERETPNSELNEIVDALCKAEDMNL